MKKGKNKYVRGARVVLVSNAYGASDANPRIGSQYECVGKIYDIYSDGKLHVLWDNGMANEYFVEDLLIVDNSVEEKPKKLRLRQHLMIGDSVVLNKGVELYSHGDYFQDKEDMIFIHKDLIKEKFNKFVC